MVLLIDGYNVLYAAGYGGDLKKSERDRFVSLVSAYARALGHEAIIIFDGGSSPHPYTAMMAGVMVIESGYNQSADDLLCKKLLHFPPEIVLMVSSDRAITDEAAAHGVVSIDADAFYDRLVDVVHRRSDPRLSSKAPRVVDGVGYDKKELDILMEKACAHVQPKKVDLEDESDEYQARVSKKRKKSKAERRLERVIKKI